MTLNSFILMPVQRTPMETLDFWTEFALENYWKTLVEESIQMHLLVEASGLTKDSETGENEA